VSTHISKSGAFISHLDAPNQQAVACNRFGLPASRRPEHQKITPPETEFQPSYAQLNAAGRICAFSIFDHL
jgi:hypothetical protein